jgi:uncharacterized protein
MKQKIGIIGAGGLIGKELQKYLKSSYDIYIIKSSSLYSSPEELASQLKNLDVIINLAGYSVRGRWNKRIKDLIYNSRINTTRNLVNAISVMKTKPMQLINASAVGIYADGAICDENSSHLANNFLAKVINAWEKEANGVKDFNVNLTILRFGVVLSRSGGVYSLLRKIFLFGVGGKMGLGTQGFSYILIDDLVKIVDFVIFRKIFGVVNVVSPIPVNNFIFTQELAKKLKRPALFSIPAVFVKFLYGEGSTIVLEGQKVIPQRLTENEFQFVGNNINTCLHILEK